MSTCHFCGAENEEWMKICQQCGNPVIDDGRKHDENVEYDDNISDSNIDSYDDSKPVKNNRDLLMVIMVLSVILVLLILYTIYVVFF